MAPVQRKGGLIMMAAGLGVFALGYGLDGGFWVAGLGAGTAVYGLLSFASSYMVTGEAREHVQNRDRFKQYAAAQNAPTGVFTDSTGFSYSVADLIYEDSLDFYKDRIEGFRQSGWNNVISGAVMLPAGLVVFGYFGHCLLELGGGGGAGYAIGIGPFIVLGVMAGGALAGAGVVNLIKAKQLFDGANKYEAELKEFKERYSRVSLQFLPLLNPVDKSLGAMLALNF